MVNRVAEVKGLISELVAKLGKRGKHMASSAKLEGETATARRALADLTKSRVDTRKLRAEATPIA